MSERRCTHCGGDGHLAKDCRWHHRLSHAAAHWLEDCPEDENRMVLIDPWFPYAERRHSQKRPA